jgi:hypothetical protein
MDSQNLIDHHNSINRLHDEQAQKSEKGLIGIGEVDNHRILYVYVSDHISEAKTIVPQTHDGIATEIKKIGKSFYY